MINILKKIAKIPQALAILAIELYQRLLSPDHSWLKHRYPYGFCRHFPSCSEYVKQAIAKYGLVKGFYLGTLRIIKCNPWTEPKVDLVSNH